MAPAQNREEARSRIPFDFENMDLNMERVRATDVKGNARVILPKPLGTKEESELMLRAAQYNNIFEQFRSKNYNDKGEPKKTNLTPQQLEGLKSLKKRIKEGEIKICTTDKTGKFAVTSGEIYQRLGEPHTKGPRRWT